MTKRSIATRIRSKARRLVFREPPPLLPQTGDPNLAGLSRRILERLRATPAARDDPLQFLAFAAPLLPEARGQVFQDLWALWESGDKRSGYFVEFGAADGVEISNTYLLETARDWSGVLAEPNPDFAATLRAHRRCFISSKCVYERSGEQLDFMVTKQGGLSRIATIPQNDGREAQRAAGHRIVPVSTVSLNDLLLEARAPREIDFLSVDTEGSEFQILAAFDFDRWRIKTITVEHNYTPSRQAIEGLLTARGYRRKWPEISRFDDWYVLEA